MWWNVCTVLLIGCWLVFFIFQFATLWTILPCANLARLTSCAASWGDMANSEAISSADKPSSARDGTLLYFPGDGPLVNTLGLKTGFLQFCGQFRHLEAVLEIHCWHDFSGGCRVFLRSSPAAQLFSSAAVYKSLFFFFSMTVRIHVARQIIDGMTVR